MDSCLTTKEVQVIVIKTVLKPDLTHVILPDDFNNDLYDSQTNEYLFYEGITEIVFGKEFNRKINPGELPESLTSLKFGENFDQYICPNVLPKNLKYLEFGEKYCCTIYNEALPYGLTTLIFKGDFMVKCRDALPRTVTTIGYIVDDSWWAGSWCDNHPWRG
jgi:hypothetical protein